MTYIYINTYNVKGIHYYYVGSHTWDGKGIDSNYEGSSSIVKHYGWKPLKIRVLEVCEGDRKYKAEKEWILRYCKKYGIADCASVIAPAYCIKWISQFRKGGLMLNCCAADTLIANNAACQKIIEDGQSELQRTLSYEHLQLAHKKYREILSTDIGRKSAIEKAAYMRTFEQERRKREGLTEAQKKAYSNHAKILNAKKREGLTLKQLQQCTKNMVACAKKGMRMQ